MAELVDVVIIGSGAGGGPLALSLSHAGARVVVLEKGPRHQRSEYVHDELLLEAEDGFFVPKMSEDPHTLAQADGTSKRTSIGWIGSCVGGGTCRMGSSFYRFHPSDFAMKSTFGTHHEMEDWPYGYEDLEPYYSRTEWAVGVAGQAGTNPFEPPRSVPFPMPPLDFGPVTTLFEKACARLGLHPFPTPRAINSRPYGGRPACEYCSFCTGHGCPTGARGSAQETVLAVAEQTGNCEVRPQCMAREITVQPNGRVDGCIYIDKSGRENRLRAKVVAVCCSAMESARLLLLSSSRLYPDGLANSSGLVGRHLQLHGYSAGSAFFPDIPQKEKQRRYALGRSVMDYYLLPPGVTDLPKGGILRFDLANRHPIRACQRLAQEPSGRLLWGKRLKQKLNQNFRETVEVEFEVFHDFLPNPNSYIDLDPHVKDRWGLPVARIHLADTPHQQKAGGWLVERGLEILKTMGAEQVTATAIGKTTPFLVHGTCRAGKKPRESVLNEFCQAHDTPNLWVVDGSFMPTSGGAPSTLTIMANSFRAADAILAGANRGDFN